MPSTKTPTATVNRTISPIAEVAKSKLAKAATEAEPEIDAPTLSAVDAPTSEVIDSPTPDPATPDPVVADSITDTVAEKIEPISNNISEEEAVNQAVQVLSNLATLKLKVQESRDQALQVRAQVDVLFTDEVVTEEAIVTLKDGFKTLRAFAQTNLRYREAKTLAEQARAVLDRVL